MSLLVVGKRRETRTLVRLLRRGDPSAAFHVPDQSAALAAIEKTGEPFDFVLLEAEEEVGIQQSVMQAIRTHQAGVTIAVISYAEAVSDQPRLVGVFERSKAGLRILNCVVSDPHPGRADGNRAGDLGQIIYEFSAVPRKRQ